MTARTSQTASVETRGMRRRNKKKVKMRERDGILKWRRRRRTKSSKLFEARERHTQQEKWVNRRSQMSPAAGREH